MIRASRNWLYERGFFRPVELPAFAVSVGNISLGGTGKSPFVILLAEWAAARGIPTAVLSRGYKREHKNLEIVGPREPLPAASRLGDEPWMIKHRRPELSLLVHADRARLALQHWPELGAPRFIILDDAFQHWKVVRQRDVVMVDAGESLTQGTFPLGRLREPASALRRADLVVITRAKSISPGALRALEDDIRKIAAVPSEKPWKKERASRPRVVSADYEFDYFFSLDGSRTTPPTEKKIFLVTGVAKPAGVRRLVDSLGLVVSEEISYPDHHNLSVGEVADLRRRLGGSGALLITEKDWARWQGQLRGLPVYGLRVKIQFLGGGEEALEEFMREVECSISR